MGGSFDEPPKTPMARETLVRVAKLYQPYRGTNEELLQRSSLYRQLYEEQFTVIPSLS